MSKIRLKDITSFDKGKQINGDKLISDGKYDYLNGGTKPSGKWNEYNTNGNTIAVSEGGNSCGYVNFMNNPFWCGAHCYYLYDIKCNIKYLYYALKSQQDRIMKLRSGACMPNIKKSDLGNFLFEYNQNPDDQAKTVYNLDRLTLVINLCEVITKKLDTLVKSRFVEMFGDPVSNPMNWNKVAIGKHCHIITGNTPPRANEENYGSFIEWIKSDNINTPDTFLTKAGEYLSEKGASIGRCVESGSILMTCIAGSINCIGNVGVANRKVAFNQQINAIVPKFDETMYIYWLMILSKPYIQSTINMSLKGILSKGQLSVMDFPFPPLNLQRQFADFVEQTDKSKLAVKQILEKAETLKKSLMQEYFG